MPLINSPIVGCPSRPPVQQFLYGDSDFDGDVDNADLFRFRAAFLSVLGDIGYNPVLDFDNDGDIDFVELFKFRANFGR